jgi:hypothetical protein
MGHNRYRWRYQLINQENFKKQDLEFERLRESVRIQEIVDKLHVIDTIVEAHWMMVKIQADKEDALQQLRDEIGRFRLAEENKLRVIG